MKYGLLATALLMSGFSSAYAEDDLLKILNTKGAAENIVKEQDDLTSSLRAALRNPTAEQNIFLSFLAERKFEKSLLQWRSAFEGQAFEKSASGQALYAYILFQNKLEVVGLETLFAIQKPSEINPELKKIWVLLVPAESGIWTKLSVTWNERWTDIFGQNVAAKVKSWQITDPTKTDEVLKLISQAKLGTSERYWLEWQMALGLALSGDAGKAGKVLAHLLNSKQTLISKDLIHMTAARLLYENGNLGPAIEFYKKIPKSSDYWFEAQEEAAWAYIRKGEPQNTLAVTQSLVVPTFEHFIGAESIFLRALAQLKVCDYPEVTNSIRDFSRRFRPRVQRLLTTAESQDRPSVHSFIKMAKVKRPISSLSLGKASEELPRYITRDEVIYGLIDQLVALELEAQLAGNLYARSISEGSDKIGFQSQLDELKATIVSRQQSAQSAVMTRVKVLAEEEISEIRNVLQKMHIVEAEVIQQVSLAQRVADASGKVPTIKRGSTGQKGKHTMRFPFDGEIWFDEIDNYRVDIKKGCQGAAL